MNLPAHGRSYDEKEVSRLLKRATELQREDPAGMPSGGMSLAELEEIATEAGIDPRHLRTAALEMEVGGGEPQGLDRVYGAATQVVHEEVLPGELTTPDFEDLVGVIQETAEDHGSASLVGRTLTWQAETKTKQRSVQVTVTSRDGQTRVRVEENLTQVAGAWMGGMIGGFGGGVGFGLGFPLAMGVLGSVAAALAVPVGMMGLGWVGARNAYRIYVRGRKRHVARMLRTVTEAARDMLDRRRDAADGELLPPGERGGLPSGPGRGRLADGERRGLASGDDPDRG